MIGKKKMEINPNHSIMKELKNKFTANESDRTVKDLVWLVYETAALTSGFTLKEPVVFANRIHKLIKLGLSIGGDADEEGGDDLDDLPPLEADEEEDESRMEEVD